MDLQILKGFSVIFWKTYYLLSSKIVLHIKYKYRSRCVFGGGFCALSRGVVPGGAMVPPDFGRSVNNISTKGDRLCTYAHQMILALPDFQTFRRPCTYLEYYVRCINRKLILVPFLCICTKPAFFAHSYSHDQKFFKLYNTF